MTAAKITTALATDIHACTSCGQDHPDLTMRRLARPRSFHPNRLPFTLWAICPVTGDPLLLCELSEPSTPPPNLPR